jgi:hypothetical protein
MTRYRFWLAAVVLVLVARPKAFGQILVDWSESPSFAGESVLLSGRPFTEGNLLPIARNFVNRFLGKPFAELKLAPNRDGFNYGAKLSPSVTFATWRSWLQIGFDRGVEPRAALAEVIIIGGDAVLRIRNQGKVSRVVLTARDPLVFAHGGHRFEVLHLFGRLVTAPPTERQKRLKGRELPRVSGFDASKTIPCPGCSTHIDIYVRTAWPLDLATLDGLTKRWAKLAPDTHLQVGARPDAWFVQDNTFPILYAFDEEFRIPSEEEHRKTPHLYSFYRPLPIDR